MHNSVVLQTMWEFTVSMIGLWRKSAVYPQIGRQKQKIANLSTVQRIIFDVFHRKRDIHNGAIKKTVWESTVFMIGLRKESAVYPQKRKVKTKYSGTFHCIAHCICSLPQEKDIPNGVIKKSVWKFTVSMIVLWGKVWLIHK